MSKMKKIIIKVVCIVLLSIAAIGSTIATVSSTFYIGIWAMVSYFTATAEGLPVYELTEDEKKWLIVKFGDEERIQEGRLYGGEEKQLMRARAGLAMLEEKYPGYQFCITWLDRYDTWTGFTVYEESTGEKVVLNVEGDEESGYEVTDNFYEYFFAEKYAACIKEQFEREGINDLSVSAGAFRVAGKEYDINMSVEDVISGKLEVWPIIFVDMYVGDEMSEEECEEYAQEMQKIVENANLSGSYHLYFMDTTKEEMLATGEMGEEIYKYSFKMHNK